MSKKIKILYTIPNFDRAGSGKVVYDLVKGLDKTKFAPEICVFHTRGAFYSEVEALGVPIHVFKFEATYKPITTFVFRVFKIVRFFKTQQFDLIHSWHYTSDFSEPLAARLAGIPYVYTKKAMGWGNKAWKIRTYFSTKVIAINTDMMTEFFYNMKTKVVQLPLGVDTEIYKPLKAGISLKKQLGIQEQDFVIVSVVNMVPVKGIELLLEAVNQISSSSSIKVLIVGHNESDYAKGLMQKYGSHRFVFVGKQLDVKPYIALADVFVIPTKDEGRREGMPVAPLEAMAMGIPVIGANISGIKDILQDFPELLFKPSHTKDLKQKIEYFMANRPIYKNKLVALIHEKYNLSKFINDREQFYKSILK
ncbi:glycosyltransferase [Winogradskyella vidalii]|uniref:glycosyltransferase n=1 Tax=Winogradskyella vidalii TaxID=2615024 RepID=UPI0015C89E9C|nr:glycosyltransferase [Winogradskyella vidalii]